MADYSYGGQAVIEGVMMRGRKKMAVAVRRTPEEIVFDLQPVNSLSERYRLLRVPFIRGVVALIESMVIGVKTLTYSANQVVEAEGEGETLSNWELGLSVAFALVAGIGLFALLPAGLAHLLKEYAPGNLLQNILEGILRVLIFLGYVVAISVMEDIQRVFQYHGAEHKTIFTYEAGEELTPENARKHSRLHPRCGTSFLLFVMVISILVFSLTGDTDIWTRLISRVLLLPVVAGVSYEFLKLTGKYQHVGMMRMLSLPGLYLQKLTTREPDDSQLEVAIFALQKVLEAEKEEEDSKRGSEVRGDVGETAAVGRAL
ncbi:MAG TPA: DUF1385 domain-containing protein [Peptococcaceae bacterium]|jgi:uncharacterized protein YqhQ|nr:DUF1385 domain-containing protein [Clostridia bacterium]HOB81709.1 DUF1385 domain-containing protein [Peptococcaceae bacterium]HPZ70939.1 DUF1385 domain-containing protein [Peptococcaceae bacterium]HQD54341.1 DUF1385 domain-containing protein [Peptococcaceae bacterium]